MTTAPDALLAALVPRGWSLTPAVADRTADLARLSALAIPADWAACLLRFDALVGPDEDAWFLALDDYTGTSDAAFAWDEWRTLSLDAAMGPDDAARVTRFWDDVLPILLAVGGAYAFWGVSRATGVVVGGAEPDFEDADVVAPDVAALLTALAAGTLEVPR